MAWFPVSIKAAIRKLCETDGCWPMSDGSRAGDACTMWGDDASPVGWQGCLMQIPWQANTMVDWGPCDSIPSRLSEP